MNAWYDIVAILVALAVMIVSVVGLAILFAG
jgi:hypothetical protein